MRASANPYGAFAVEPLRASAQPCDAVTGCSLARSARSSLSVTSSSPVSESRVAFAGVESGQAPASVQTSTSRVWLAPKNPTPSSTIRNAIVTFSRSGRFGAGAIRASNVTADPAATSFGRNRRPSVVVRTKPANPLASGSDDANAPNCQDASLGATIARRTRFFGSHVVVPTFLRRIWTVVLSSTGRAAGSAIDSRLYASADLPDGAVVSPVPGGAVVPEFGHGIDAPPVDGLRFAFAWSHPSATQAPRLRMCPFE
jgi:hypothetical protein